MKKTYNTLLLIAISLASTLSLSGAAYGENRHEKIRELIQKDCRDAVYACDKEEVKNLIQNYEAQIDHPDEKDITLIEHLAFRSLSEYDKAYELTIHAFALGYIKIDINTAEKSCEKLIDLKEREMQIRHESTMTQANTATRIGENSLKYIKQSR